MASSPRSYCCADPDLYENYKEVVLAVSAVGSLHPDIAKAKEGSAETDLPNFQHPTGPTNNLYCMPKDIGDISDEFRTQMRDIFSSSDILFKATNPRIKAENKPTETEVTRAKTKLNSILFEQLDINNKINQVIEGYKEIAAAKPQDSEPNTNPRQGDAAIILRQLEMIKMTFDQRMNTFGITEKSLNLEEVHEKITGFKPKVEEPKAELEEFEKALVKGGYLEEDQKDAPEAFAVAKKQFEKRNEKRLTETLGIEQDPKKIEENRAKIKEFFTSFGTNLFKACQDILPEGAADHIETITKNFALKFREGNMSFYSCLVGGDSPDDFEGNFDIGDEAAKSFTRLVQLFIHEIFTGHHLRAFYKNKARTEGRIPEELKFQHLYTSLGASECGVAEGLYHELVNNGHITKALKNTLGDQYTEEIAKDLEIFSKQRLLSAKIVYNAGIQLHINNMDADEIADYVRKNYAVTRTRALLQAVSNGWFTMANNPHYLFGPIGFSKLAKQMGLKEATAFALHQDGIVDFKVLMDKVNELEQAAMHKSAE
jgi:hypothetical protein